MLQVHIMLKESELEHEMHPIYIGRGDQFDPEYLKISRNNKMPAIIDEEGPMTDKEKERLFGAIQYRKH